jgi:DNA-binding LacI/PurR family transcriptional regulator
MEKNRVTLRDVADKAKVSVASVSRVLNNEGIVSDELRITVEKAIKELNFSYKPAKKTTASTRIGVLVGDILNEAYAPLLKGILETAQIHNIEIILSDYIRDKKKEDACINSMLENHVDGIIALPSSGKISKLYEELIADHFPLVLLISSKELCDRQDVFIVTKDSFEGAYTGTKYLLDLGHKNILLLGTPGENGIFASRLAGYTKAFETVDVPVKDELICNCLDSFEEAYQIISTRCENPNFTAIFAVTDALTLGAWKALKDKGLKVPDDFSIVGYGNHRNLKYLSITSLAEPMQEVGKNALYSILEWLRGTHTTPRTIVLRDSLIIGDSCKKI